MTTFTPEEIEQIKHKGNEYCKYVWLGLYDSRCPMEPDSRDEQRTRDMMIQKYERKRWYVDPEQALQRMRADQQARPAQTPTTPAAVPPVVANHVAQHQPGNSPAVVPDTKPLSSLLGKNSLPLVIHKSQPTTPSSATWPTPISSAATSTSTSQPMFKSNVDIFSAFGNDPFNSSSVGSTPTVPAKSSPFPANGNFANFDSVFSPTANAEPQATAPPPVTNNTNHHTPVSGDTGSGFVASFPPLSQPLATSSAVPQLVTGAGEPPNRVPPADRYAALADLDSLFHQETPSPQPQPQPLQQSQQQPAFGATSAFGVSPGSTPSNPFAATTAPVWGPAAQPAPQVQNQAFATPNPFETMAPPPHMGGVFGGLDNPGMPQNLGGVFGGGANGFAMAPPNMTQQKGTYPGWGVASPQGGITSPPGGVAAWGKVGGPLNNDWSQMAAPSPANPFLSGQMPRTNSSNPFL